MACNECPGSVLFARNNILKEVFCKKNIVVFSGTLAAACAATYKYFFSSFAPFVLSSDAPGYEMNIVETSSIMEGAAGNDLMIAHQDGSAIFAKGGLNYIIANDGPDKLYYSLCSTDIIDNKVGVVKNFDIEFDKLFFFCTKKEIFAEDIEINHDKIGDIDITYVQVTGQDKISAIALLGDIPLQVEDIILNQKWGM